MYLSRLTFRCNDRRAAAWFSNPYRIHQRLLRAWPDGASRDDTSRFLYRVEWPQDGDQATAILAQAPIEADWLHAFDDLPILAEPPEQKPFEPQLRVDQVLRFRLRANPTKRLPQGRRVELLREEEQRTWLARKASAAGFAVLAVDVTDGDQVHGTKEAHAMTWRCVDFNGHLRVTDPHALRAALAAGIGSAKGFGFGLLSLAPPRH